MQFGVFQARSRRSIERIARSALNACLAYYLANDQRITGVSAANDLSDEQQICGFDAIVIDHVSLPLPVLKRLIQD